VKILTRGDIDGFFVLSASALLDLILMRVLLVGFLGFSEGLYYTRVLPAAATGLIVGNGFYAWQAIKLARREGRDDVTAMPFGTSALVAIVFVYLVMYPVQQQALASGVSKDAADLLSWHAGVIACLGCGLMEFVGAFVAQGLRTVVPRPALLIAIGGTGLAFVGMDFIFRTFAYPVIGMPTLMLVLVLFVGGARLRTGIPGAVIILALGVVLSMLSARLGIGTPVHLQALDLSYVGLHLPVPVIAELLPSLHFLLDFLPVILPIALIFLIGSLQNIEAAAAAGDDYNAKPLLLMNGGATMIGAALGSPFPVTIYLGHPGYKRIGARATYSTLNAMFWTLVCFTGTVSLAAAYIPIEAGMALVLYIGLVVCAQAFEVTDKRYAVALVTGLMPAFAAYVTLVVKHSLGVAKAISGVSMFTPDLTARFAAERNFFAEGLFALGQGYIFTCMVFTAIVMYVIDRNYTRAAIWCLVGAVLSAFGVVHTHLVAAGDVVGHLNVPLPKWNGWSTGYTLMAIVVYSCRWLTLAKAEHDDREHVNPAKSVTAPQSEVELPLPAKPTRARG
jgi:AGZA family xanthine/uracil permease-like MFS transporter